jgi:hypothetical protein
MNHPFAQQGPTGGFCIPNPPELQEKLQEQRSFEPRPGH